MPFSGWGERKERPCRQEQPSPAQFELSPWVALGNNVRVLLLQRNFVSDLSTCRGGVTVPAPAAGVLLSRHLQWGCYCPSTCSGGVTVCKTLSNLSKSVCTEDTLPLPALERPQEHLSVQCWADTEQRESEAARGAEHSSRAGGAAQPPLALGRWKISAGCSAPACPRLANGSCGHQASVGCSAPVCPGLAARPLQAEPSLLLILQCRRQDRQGPELGSRGAGGLCGVPAHCIIA